MSLLVTQLRRVTSCKIPVCFRPKIFIPQILDILFILLIFSFQQKLKIPQQKRRDNRNLKKQQRRSPKSQSTRPQNKRTSLLFQFPAFVWPASLHPRFHLLATTCHLHLLEAWALGQPGDFCSLTEQTSLIFQSEHNPETRTHGGCGATGVCSLLPVGRLASLKRDHFKEGYLFFFFNWSIVDLQSCVSFRCRAKWLSCTYV